MLNIEMVVIALKDKLYYLLHPHRELIFDTLPADPCVGGRLTIHRGQAILDRTAEIDLCHSLPQPTPCFHGLTALFGEKSPYAVATPVIRAEHCRQDDVVIVTIPAMKRPNEFVASLTEAYHAARTALGNTEVAKPLPTEALRHGSRTIAVPRVMKFFEP